MAHPRITAIRRQNADLRQRKAAEAVAARFGVSLKVPATPPGRYPDLYAAELAESMADLLEQLAARSIEAAQPKPQPQRKAS